MTTLEKTGKPTRQDTTHISFRKNIEEKNLYHQILRRSSLTQTPISKVIKEYCKEGVKNDVFLKQFS